MQPVDQHNVATNDGIWADLVNQRKPERTFRPKLAEALKATPNHLWDLAPQVGVRTAVMSIPESPDLPPPWDEDHLRSIKDRLNAAGFEWAVVESAPSSIQEPIKLGLPDSDQQIDNFCKLLETMGKLGITVMCHNWMAGYGWMRTDLAIPSRGGAFVTGYDQDQLPLDVQDAFGTVTEEQLWERMDAFLKRVVPVAERAGVKLAVHPDDPPRSPVRGVGRILTNPDAFQRVIDMYPSPNNGITFCQGNFAAMGVDVPKEIRRFGNQKQIHFVHFRDVRGTRDRFIETFHEDGQTDMLETMHAYADVGFDGPMRPDHVPTMAGEDNTNPGYAVTGRLFALGYMTGLIEAANRR
ncbi:MAG: mannonate dehydratase [Thermomicrobiales bacterium]